MSKNFDELIFGLESELDDDKIKAARMLAQIGDMSVMPVLEAAFKASSQTSRYFIKKAIDAIKAREAAGQTAPQPETPASSPAINRPSQSAVPPSRPITPAAAPAEDDDPLAGIKLTPKAPPQPVIPPAPKPAAEMPAAPAPAAKIEITDSELLTKLSKLQGDAKIKELERVFEEGDYDLLDNVVVAKLSEMIGTEKEIDAACWYIKLVSKNGGVSFLQTVARYLKHPNPKVIAAALEALYYIKDKNLANIILQFVRHPDREVQSSALCALWTNDFEKSRQIIEKMLNADEREYRYVAASAISKVPDDKSMELAMSIFYNEEDPEIFKLGVSAIQRKTNDNNYYKLKEIIDTLPPQKAGFIKQIVDKFEKIHHTRTDDYSLDTENAISLDEDTKPAAPAAPKPGIKPAFGRKPLKPAAETFSEQDLVIDENNLKPVQTLLIEIGSKKELERIRAVKMLAAHLKKGAIGDTLEQISFALELAQNDSSSKVRDEVTNGLKFLKK
ncbi:MAG: HEAT repeat domain-containing protein [Candidatus Wallbacteria bacterium]